LLLLVKIDHNLLGEKEKLNPAELIRQKTDNFQELISQRNIHVHCSCDGTTVSGNKYQFDILLNNLFSNAIRHNKLGGEIRISVKNGLLNFENTGNTNALSESQIFERFYKDPQSDGVGLGLAILKQICIKQGYSLRYYFRLPMHGFELQLGS